MIGQADVSGRTSPSSPWGLCGWWGSCTGAGGPQPHMCHRRYGGPRPRWSPRSASGSSASPPDLLQGGETKVSFRILHQPLGHQQEPAWTMILYSKWMSTFDVQLVRILARLYLYSTPLGSGPPRRCPTPRWLWNPDSSQCFYDPTALSASWDEKKELVSAGRSETKRVYYN